jgi:hypothetical protein
MKAIRPLAEEGDTVLLSRADYESLVRQAEVRVEAGEDEYVPVALTRRLMAGEIPVRVWREHRGISARALASRAGISTAYLSQIEAKSPARSTPWRRWRAPWAWAWKISSGGGGEIPRPYRSRRRCHEPRRGGRFGRPKPQGCLESAQGS